MNLYLQKRIMNLLEKVYNLARQNKDWSEVKKIIEPDIKGVSELTYFLQGRFKVDFDSAINHITVQSGTYRKD